VQAVLKVSEGNPFFVESLVHHLAGSGTAVVPPGLRSADLNLEQLGLPDDIREITGRRLAHLSARCNRALAIASVAGQTFDLAVLGRISSLEDDEFLDWPSRSSVPSSSASAIRATSSLSPSSLELISPLQSATTTRRFSASRSTIGAMLPDDPSMPGMASSGGRAVPAPYHRSRTTRSLIDRAPSVGDRHTYRKAPARSAEAPVRWPLGNLR
jgi:hypothetical protein